MQTDIKLSSVLLAIFLLISSTLIAEYVHSRNKFIEIEHTVENSVTEIVKIVNLEQLQCLAMNIYHEAGNEPKIGQIAVARVVMNRIAHGFASNPCKVIYQTHVINNNGETKKTCQFSWVCENKSINMNNPKYKQAIEIANKVLSENAWSDIIPENILFFHNTSVKPRWPYNPVIVIGNHIFYSKTR